MNQELCRNGERKTYFLSPIQLLKSLEQERSVVFGPPDALELRVDMVVAAEQLKAFTTGYSPVETSPVLASARAAARAEAYQIIEQRREHLRDAEYDAVPLPVDVLSSAQAVIDYRVAHGAASPEAGERYQGLRLDCQRLLAEAARKNTYEYFPPLLQSRDAQTGDYFSHGFSIMALTKAGLSPIAEPEEIERRVNERVEEVTYKAIGQLAVLGKSLTPETTSAGLEPEKPRRIRTISECPEWAIESYERNPNGAHGGFVPEIRKFMIRDVVFDPLTNDRYEEQVGAPGLLITHDVILRVLAARGVALSPDISKTELQATQLEVDDDLLDFMDLLDAAATTHDQAVFMGEPVVRAPTSREYEGVPAIAITRQEKLARHASELADGLIGLAQIGTDRWAAAGIVEAQVKTILLGMADRDNSLAGAMFNASTARGFEEVTQLRLKGEDKQAQVLLELVEAKAPKVSYCGAGSCGLENIGVSSTNAKKMKDMGLESSGSLKDTVRACPNCQKKEVVYDIKNKIKGCTNCKSKIGFGRK